MSAEIRKWAGMLLAAAVLAAGLYTWARLHRYEVIDAGNDRYYVIVKLDRWTGQTWKFETGGVWHAMPARDR